VLSPAVATEPVHQGSQQVVQQAAATSHAADGTGGGEGRWPPPRRQGLLPAPAAALLVGTFSLQCGLLCRRAGLLSARPAAVTAGSSTTAAHRHRQRAQPPWHLSKPIYKPLAHLSDIHAPEEVRNGHAWNRSLVPHHLPHCPVAGVRFEAAETVHAATSCTACPGEAFGHRSEKAHV